MRQRKLFKKLATVVLATSMVVGLAPASYSTVKAEEVTEETVINDAGGADVATGGAIEVDNSSIVKRFSYEWGRVQVDYDTTEFDNACEKARKAVEGLIYEWYYNLYNTEKEKRIYLYNGHNYWHESDKVLKEFNGRSYVLKPEVDTSMWAIVNELNLESVIKSNTYREDYTLKFYKLPAEVETDWLKYCRFSTYDTETVGLLNSEGYLYDGSVLKFGEDEFNRYTDVYQDTLKKYMRDNERYNCSLGIGKVNDRWYLLYEKDGEYSGSLRVIDYAEKIMGVYIDKNRFDKAKDEALQKVLEEYADELIAKEEAEATPAPDPEVTTKPETEVTPSTTPSTKPETEVTPSTTPSTKPQATSPSVSPSTKPSTKPSPSTKPAITAPTKAIKVSGIKAKKNTKVITGKAIKGATVKVKIGTKTYKAKANSKGKFTIKVKKLKKGQKYTLTVTCKGYTTYKKTLKVK